mmetsp:Transcript_33735/g.77841  ORF Transcript_33735/g.77841 Transcript_33735/m.77841 type:complete len:117 (-) Transcript_33735:36-386(-)
MISNEMNLLAVVTDPGSLSAARSSGHLILYTFRKKSECYSFFLGSIGDQHFVGLRHGFCIEQFGVIMEFFAFQYLEEFFLQYLAEFTQVQVVPVVPKRFFNLAGHALDAQYHVVHQ